MFFVLLSVALINNFFVTPVVDCACSETCFELHQLSLLNRFGRFVSLVLSFGPPFVLQEWLGLIIYLAIKFASVLALLLCVHAETSTQKTLMLCDARGQLPIV